MKKTKDQVKLRREYLVRKAGANTQKAVGGILMYGCGIAAGLYICSLLSSVMTGICNDGLTPELITGIQVAAIGLTYFGFLAHTGFCILRKAYEGERRLRYVPPVQEQIAALPAKKVLLRGSQPPPASPEELLRPAAGQETSAEELLRAAAGREQGLPTVQRQR